MRLKYKNQKGATIIELLLYIGIFLIVIPTLLVVSIDSAQQKKEHTIEKQVNVDSQYIVERIYDIISKAKKINVSTSEFDKSAGKLSLTNQDDEIIIVELDTDNNVIKITEDAVTSTLSSSKTEIKSLYFEKMPTIESPDVVLGVTVRMNIKGDEKVGSLQNYVTSANLIRGDFDGDGCIDTLDKFPKHSQCCGDADVDGICDELDNCVLEYNPFQEDFDIDNVGDACDNNVYLGDGDDDSGGGLGAFNCSTDDQLIALIEQDPSLSSGNLKQILVSSSPLTPTVLNKLIDTHPLMKSKHFNQVFIANVKLTDEVFNKLNNASNISFFSKIVISAAHYLADYIPWLGTRINNNKYQVSHTEYECDEKFENSIITFYNSENPLSSDFGQVADVIIINVNGGSETVTVTTETLTGTTSTDTFTGGGSTITNSSGFQITLESITGNNYAFTIGSSKNKTLDSIKFNFGCGAKVDTPPGYYNSRRYVTYCEGGCSAECGGIGTGVLTQNIYTDKCYKSNRLFFPEWCSRWYTFGDDDKDNPAYIGGTQQGVETSYWEKSFKTMLTQGQLANLQSITVAGDVAYQSTNQFFCDTLSSSCLMKGSLSGGQDVELYNWNTEVWDAIGVMGLDGTSSDQQKFDLVHVSNVLNYIGGQDNRVIKARMKFSWNGVPPPSQTSAPCFMLIDYFTLHLKW